MAMHPSGVYQLAWIESGFHLNTVQYDPIHGVGSTVLLDTFTATVAASNKNHPAVALDDDKNIIVLYIRNDEGSAQQSLWSRYCSNETDVWTDPEEVESGVMNPYTLDVIFTNDGDALTIFGYSNTISRNIIHANAYSPTVGWAPTLSKLQVDDDFNYSSRSPMLIKDPHGRISAFWIQNSDESYINNAVYHSTYNDDLTWSSSEMISDITYSGGSGSNIRDFDADANGSGQIMAVWDQYEIIKFNYYD
jgi:hypothetical protein